MDLSVASLAVRLVVKGGRLTDVRLAAGSVAPVPLRLKPVEALLTGAELDARLIDEAAALAADSIAPIDDVRASATYRRQIISAYLSRVLGQAMGGHQP